ncbi:MAG: hypothetical protein K2K22_07750 [Muribaculaceae bacterium]|nr:hypothetical protein [Muribaculaceae bacterium]
MICSIFQTVEFYVIAAFVAAAVVGAAAMPKSRGAVRTFLFGGTLRHDATPSQAGIVALVNDRGRLEIHRFGLDGVDMSGAYSLAVSVSGFDVTVEERLVPGRGREGAATAAYAELDCFGAERYHFQYRSEAIGASCAFSLNIRPGNRIERLLS